MNQIETARVAAQVAMCPNYIWSGVRQQERATVVDHLRTRSGGLIILRGVPGTGKSALVAGMMAEYQVNPVEGIPTVWATTNLLMSSSLLAPAALAMETTVDRLESMIYTGKRCVLVVDEIDAAFDTSVGRGRARGRHPELDQLLRLACMPEGRLTVIGTCNRHDFNVAGATFVDFTPYTASDLQSIVTDRLAATSAKLALPLLRHICNVHSRSSGDARAVLAAVRDVIAAGDANVVDDVVVFGTMKDVILLTPTMMTTVDQQPPVVRALLAAVHDLHSADPAAKAFTTAEIAAKMEGSVSVALQTAVESRLLLVISEAPAGRGRRRPVIQRYALANELREIDRNRIEGSN